MQPASELVMEQTPALKRVRDSANAPIKSILFVVHDDDGLEARLQAALSLARACSAHVRLLQVVPLEAYTIVDSYGGTFVNSEIVEALDEQAEKVRRQLEAHLAKEDVSWSYEVTTSATIPELLTNAALADLVFIGRQPSWLEPGGSGIGLLGELVCRTRTPLCIPGDGRETFDPFGKAIIGWNGSVEAANAVRASIGLLRLASEVRVVRYTEAQESAFPDTGLLEYLSRHGIAAVLETRVARSDFANDLIEYAGLSAAQYLVIGGYSHSRSGEFLFGGVTRDLLRACPVSLVIAH